MPKKRTPKWLNAAKLQNRSPTGSQFDWLARSLSRAGILSPNEAEAAIRGGRVRVNGAVQTQPFAALRSLDRVEVDGRAVSTDAATIAVMLHKPPGYICAASDPERIGTVFEVLERTLPSDLRRYGWHAIGRLDRDTSGLLLFTNDERLVAHVTSPQTHLSKRYLARVSGQLLPEKLEPLRRGIMLDDGPARPAIVTIRVPDVVELEITEGRHHQVKRMLGAVGLPVKKLQRVAIGKVELDVDCGCSRLLMSNEISDGLQFGPAPPRS